MAPSLQHVFMSYSRKDTAVMKRVIKFLEDRGIRVWVDDELVPGTPTWRKGIENAIINSSAVVVILSPDANSSIWVEREVSFAETHGKRIFPILVAGNEKSSIPIGLTSIQRTDIRQNEKEDKELSSLTAALKSYLGELEKRESEEQERKAAEEKAKKERAEKARQEKEKRERKDAVEQGKKEPAVRSIVSPVRQTTSEKKQPSRKQKTVIITVGGLIVLCLIFSCYLISRDKSETEPVQNGTPQPTRTPQPTQPTPTYIPEDFGIGSTMESEIDEMTMMYVPAGGFVRGFVYEYTVYLDAYWIDQTEVTNAMYADYLNSKGNQIEGGVTWLDTSAEDIRIHLVSGTWKVDDGYENHPVVEVSWYGANSYCIWAGRRLPTEAEWEKAARWDEKIQQSYQYPWGNTFDGTELNFCDVNCDSWLRESDYDDGYATTAPVGSFPTGASPYEVYDLIGNVNEWVSDWYDQNFYRNSPPSNPMGPETGTTRVYRGLSWANIFGAATTTGQASWRFDGDPTESYGDKGFRCARDAEP